MTGAPRFSEMTMDQLVAPLGAAVLLVVTLELAVQFGIGYGARIEPLPFAPWPSWFLPAVALVGYVVFVWRWRTQ
jgi:hypothetical protein